MAFEYGTATRIDEVLSIKIGQLHLKSQVAVRKRLKIYAAKAHATCPDMPIDLHSQQWKHSKACHWLEDGIAIVEISKLLGHESLETTMIYQEITREKQIRVLATLDEEISKDTPKKWKQPNEKSIRDYFCFD